MGYSCNTISNLSLEHLISQLQGAGEETSNSWGEDPNRFFYEIGREQHDGAITGVVRKMIADNRCKVAGSFRVEPSGIISRFPDSTKKQRNHAFNVACAKFARMFNDNILNEHLERYGVKCPV